MPSACGSSDLVGARISYVLGGWPRKFFHFGKKVGFLLRMKQELPILALQISSLQASGGSLCGRWN